MSALREKDLKNVCELIRQLRLGPILPCRNPCARSTPTKALTKAKQSFHTGCGSSIVLRYKKTPISLDSLFFITMTLFMFSSSKQFPY